MPVFVEVASVEPAGNGRRLISREDITRQLLSEHLPAVEEAIGVVQATLTRAAAEQENKGWTVSELEATFSLTLTAEAGVLVSKVGAEAALEVTVHVTRA